MAEQHIPKVGEAAPDFTLPAIDGKKVSLSEFKGKKHVILSFHPLAWTSVCGAQMLNLELSQAELEKLDAVALGMNVDPLPSKTAWAKALGISKLVLLSDFEPKAQTAEKFGIRRKEGFSERAVFVVDKQGIVRFAKVYPIGQLPDLNEALEVLRSLQ
ncbi:MAG: redoxin domain-containing protein [Chloroflexi bacterium]|nr:redoxin domain-containing protein [Chloroflexota bacterium]